MSYTLTCSFLIYFWDCNIFATILSSLSSFQVLSYTPFLSIIMAWIFVFVYAYAVLIITYWVHITLLECMFSRMTVTSPTPSFNQLSIILWGWYLTDFSLSSLACSFVFSLLQFNKNKPDFRCIIFIICSFLIKMKLNL